MKELLRTNNVVLLNFLQVLFEDVGIDHDIFDQNMSAMDGSIGVLPRRVMVSDAHYRLARRTVIDALGPEAAVEVLGDDDG